MRSRPHKSGGPNYSWKIFATPLISGRSVASGSGTIGDSKLAAKENQTNHHVGQIDMSTSLSSLQGSASHQLARERFGRKSMADKYPSEYQNRWRDRREKACILECMKAIPTGGRVLDLPCGTGRLTRMLIERGYRVTGADVSEAMLSRARDNYRDYQQQHGTQAPAVQFEIRDVLATGFNTDQFDGVMCIRLFHHFDDAETRRRALKELRRICHGPIVVTFLNSFALDRFGSWVKHRMRGKKQTSQLPIPLKTFVADVEAAGLKVERRIAAHWGISSRWFLVLRRQGN
jgi:SAM-dependent methyltransferase